MSAADAYVWVPGAEQETVQTADEAIAAYNRADPADRSFSDEAGAYCDLALARVAQRELDGAAEALSPVLELPANQRIEGITASLQRVHAALRNPVYLNAAAARDLQGQIEVFQALPRALPSAR